MRAWAARSVKRLGFHGTRSGSLAEQTEWLHVFMDVSEESPTFWSAALGCAARTGPRLDLAA